MGRSSPAGANILLRHTFPERITLINTLRSALLLDKVDERGAAVGRDRARHFDDPPLDGPGQAVRCGDLRVRALDFELEKAVAGIDVDFALSDRLGAGRNV